MLRHLVTGLPVMVLCLALQATFVTLCIRGHVRFRHPERERSSRFHDILLLSLVMLLMLLGNFVQMGIWAALFMLIGEFDNAATALYFSAVNFSTLGYGDIVLSERWRLLGPLESANGILMFGVSTAVMTAAVIDVLKRNEAGSEAQNQP